MKRPDNCIPNKEIASKIRLALEGYKKTWESEELTFEELCFCILTPQSSAKQAIKTINLLKQHNLLDKGSAKSKEKYLKNVRFYKTKAERLEQAQAKFPPHKIKQILVANGVLDDTIKCREFLFNEVKGYGMKEASHFLRNIGFGDRVAILDRHILKNLVKCGVISELPKTLTKKKYLEIEELMRKFCKKHSIGFAELDLIFWSNETGEVLK